MFVSTPGHRADVLEHPSLRTIIERGLLWASK
jgi:type 1 glutamine amidotransferase